jgi:hypothetical protein
VEREEGDGGVRAVQRSPSSSRLGLGLSGGVVYEVLFPWLLRPMYSQFATFHATYFQNVTIKLVA